MNDYSNYKIFNAKEWADNASKIILDKIISEIIKKETCSVVLTGGKSSSYIYNTMSKSKDFHNLKNVNFYLGDERVKIKNLKDTNFYLVMNSLFKYGLPHNCKVYPIYKDSLSIDEMLHRYNSIVPKEFDLMIFSMADDGHIASIFSEYIYCENMKDLYIEAKSPRHDFTRITINPNKLTCGKVKYLLVRGEKKIQLLSKAWGQNISMGLPFELLKHDEFLIEESDSSDFLSIISNPRSR